MISFQLPILLLCLLFGLSACAMTGASDGSSGPSQSMAARPFLMFQDGKAEEAMNFYTGLFDDGAILSTNRYGAEGPGPEGSMMVGYFRVGGLEVMVSDSPIRHEFDFTPSWSLFVDCASKEEVDRLAEALGADGKVMMPPGNYGFSQHFAWVSDRYGISWQLNLPFAD